MWNGNRRPLGAPAALAARPPESAPRALAAPLTWVFVRECLPDVFFLIPVASPWVPHWEDGGFTLAALPPAPAKRRRK